MKSFLKIMAFVSSLNLLAEEIQQDDIKKHEDKIELVNAEENN